MREVRIVATVEYRDGTITYRSWRSESDGSIHRIKARIKAREMADPEVAHVELGNALVQYSYGAH